MQKHSLLLAGAGVLLPFSASAITVTVPAGTVDNSEVNTVVTQNVYGTTNGSRVLGTQNVMNGGISNASEIYGYQNVNDGGLANDTEVFSYGKQTVGKGGKANDSVVHYYGIMDVYGEADGAKVETYGSMNVKNGGVSKNAEVQGGKMYVLSGGEAYDTQVSSGYQYVSGKDYNAVISGSGEQVVRSGGKAQDTQILTGGRQVVDLGGKAFGTVIDGGTQNISGDAEGTILKSGTQNVLSSAYIENATVEGGKFNVNGGAYVKDLTMLDGATKMYSGTIVDGLTQISGGKLDTYGTTFFNDIQTTGGDVVNYGEMNIFGNASFENLEMKDSVLRVVNNGVFRDITVNNLTGAGTFYLHSNVSEGKSDRLVVENGSGDFAIGMADYSGSDAFPDVVHLVESHDADEKFHLLGGAVDIGAYRYDLVQQGDEWVLNRTPQLSDTSQIAKNTYSAISSIFFTHLDNLNDRMGEVRYTDERGVWVRGFGRKVNLDFEDNTDAKVNVAGTQIGVDADLNQDVFNRWLVGVYGGYSDARQKFDRAGRADADTYSLGVYSTIENQNGYYLDLVGTYFWHKQKITSYLPMGWDVKGDYDVESWNVSAEVGKRWNLQNNWFLEPQLQVSYMNIDDVSYRTNFNTSVDAKRADSVLARAGLMTGKKFEDVLDFPFETFVRFSVLQGFNSETKVKVADYTFNEDISNTMYRIGAGINADVSDKISLHMNLATTWGEKVDIPLEGNFGLRYSF